MSTKETKSTSAFGLGLSDGLLIHVGAFVATWNYMELLMSTVVHVALDIMNSPAVEEIMSSPSVIPRARIMRESVKAKIDDPEIKKLVTTYTNEICALSDYRNSIVHGHWFIDPTTDIAFARKTLLASKRVTEDSLAQKISQTRALIAKLLRLEAKILLYKAAKMMTSEHSP